jgi:hypothetical protein
MIEKYFLWVKLNFHFCQKKLLDSLQRTNVFLLRIFGHWSTKYKKICVNCGKNTAPTDTKCGNESKNCLTSE